MALHIFRGIRLSFFACLAVDIFGLAYLLKSFIQRI